MNGKNNDAEVIILNDSKSILMNFVIIKEGVCVYESNDISHSKRVLFEVRT